MPFPSLSFTDSGFSIGTDLSSTSFVSCFPVGRSEGRVVGLDDDNVDGFCDSDSVGDDDDDDDMDGCPDVEGFPEGFGECIDEGELDVITLGFGDNEGALDGFPSVDGFPEGFAKLDVSTLGIEDNVGALVGLFVVAGVLEDNIVGLLERNTVGVAEGEEFSALHPT